jgi:DNA-binding response OmpR family regulator
MLRSVRILVVEDERALAAALQRGLRAEGFAVDTSADGLEGSSSPAGASTTSSSWT